MDERLDGWSEIAAFFRKDPRTVQRWARDRGMPVHHLANKPKSPVYAFVSELRGWSKAGPEYPLDDTEDIAERIVDRVADLSQAKNLYRKNFSIRFALQRFGFGVKAVVATEYEIVNGSKKRQPYTQEVTIDDCESGHVELMSVSIDGKPITLLRSPSPTEHHSGYSSYKGRTTMIEPNSLGKRYIGVANWVVIRRESDFWYLHCGIPTLGVRVETVAPPDFEITKPYSSTELLTVGQHIDITWKRRR